MFLYGTFILALHQCFEVYLVNLNVIVKSSQVKFIFIAQIYMRLSRNLWCLLSKVTKNTWVMLEMFFSVAFGVYWEVLCEVYPARRAETTSH